jgi:hypothetical protein
VVGPDIAERGEGDVDLPVLQQERGALAVRRGVEADGALTFDWFRMVSLVNCPSRSVSFLNVVTAVLADAAAWAGGGAKPETISVPATRPVAANNEMRADLIDFLALADGFGGLPGIRLMDVL